MKDLINSNALDTIFLLAHKDKSVYDDLLNVIQIQFEQFTVDFKQAICEKDVCKIIRTMHSLKSNVILLSLDDIIGIVSEASVLPETTPFEELKLKTKYVTDKLLEFNQLIKSELE